jgi:AAA-like domain
MKTFCIAGPIISERHYFIPKRLNWNHVDTLVYDMKYFLLHAPRQSGKTTAIIEYVKYVNEEGDYTALYLSTEPAHPAKNDVERALYWILSQFDMQISIYLPNQERARNFLQAMLKERPVPEDSLMRFLKFWAETNDKPLALFLDEIDGLVENTLISLLKQLRTGYTNRPHYFPQSVCLIGVRNLQDYKLQAIGEQEKGILLSPFNIVADSLLLRNFTEDQLRDLYLQHTHETGQIFTDEALSHAYYLTQGQPWLVNALAYQACFRDITDRTQPITKEIIEKAKDKLILRMDTHINGIIERLNEPRVRNIIDAIISGSEPFSLNPDDIQYVRDLGLIKENNWEIANPIYQQVISRALTYIIQGLIPDQTSWYIDSSGKLNMSKLLLAFTQFFRENSIMFSGKVDYQESLPHILLMAFLQRIINGGGDIHREYALGRKRVDLCIVWKRIYRYIIELKIKRGEDTLSKGLQRMKKYLMKSLLIVHIKFMFGLCNLYSLSLCVDNS